MNYKVTKTNNLFHVIEKQTDQTIKTFEKNYEAYKLCNKLNAGAGFEGWTPTFFLKN
jgi:hypothetical protein